MGCISPPPRPPAARSSRFGVALRRIFPDVEVAYDVLMTMTRKAILGFVAAISLAPSLAAATPLGVVKESGRIAGYAVRDGVQTVGWTIRDFFVHGPRTAKRTWKANAARTKADARTGKARIVREAHDER